MTLLSLIIALALEQFRPLDAARVLHQPLAALGRFFEHRFNDGKAIHGTIAWCLMVLPPVIVTAVMAAVAHSLGWVVELLFSVAVLYLTTGFRHVSHFFTRIHAALRAQDLETARQQIGAWRVHLHDRSSSQEVAKLAIEEALVASHRQVFAIVVAFVLLGPAGAVLYRMAAFYARLWGRGGPGMGQFGEFAVRAFAAIEWLPVRVTAMAFSIVGDFEDAAYCWRTQAPSWPDKADGILMAAGGGALGVRLGGPIQQSGELIDRPELGTGDEAEVDFLQSLVGLVRRTLVLYAAGLLFIGVVRWAA